MTPVEKQAVLARIIVARDTVAESQKTIAQYPSPIKSPWTVFSFSSWVTTHRFVTAVAAFLIVAISGNTIVLAANEALPGDRLYSFKVNVAEPVRVALATDPVKKAEVQTDLVQARFEEAEVLAARGELDDEREREISERIDRHVVEVSKNVEEVQKISPEKAEDANIAVEASMNVHAKILSTIETRANRSWSSNTSRIATKARETAKKFEVRSGSDDSRNEDSDDDSESVLAVAPAAPQAMMMSVAATAPAPETEASTFSAAPESSSRMMKSASGIENASEDLVDDSRSFRSKSIQSVATVDSDDTGNNESATSTQMTIELKKQKKEQEIYEKVRVRLDKEIKKDDERSWRSGSGSRSGRDSDRKDDDKGNDREDGSDRDDSRDND